MTGTGMGQPSGKPAEHEGPRSYHPARQPHQSPTLLTHICAKARRGGRFWIKRITIAKRMRAKLQQIKVELKRRRHLPLQEQGMWLRRVLQGHLNHYAVPGNWTAIRQFRTQINRHWLRSLRRRSQRGRRLTWAKMNEYINRWIPPVRILHPFPDVRFAARTQGRSPVR